MIPCSSAEEIVRLQARVAALEEALRFTIDKLDAFKVCPYCGYDDDADERPMRHTDTCFFPVLARVLLDKEATT